MFNIPDSVKYTLHYDTTSQCKIDGGWSSIILSFSNKKRFALRPLFFAFEDRALLDCLQKQFIVSAKNFGRKNFGNKVSPKELWEKTSIIMTDSAEKNLHVAKVIPEKF